MRLCYADPPYPGLAQKYYGCEEVDHRALVKLLRLRFPAGWALSTSASALQGVLALCPDDVRVCAWVRGARPCASWRPRSSWEPLIVCGGRPRLLLPSERLDDSLVFGGRQHSHPGALIGMKPAPFAEWMFLQLGALAGDRLHDMFPGSGAIGRAWDLYTRVADAGDPSPRGSHDGPPPGARDASLGAGDVTRDSCPAGDGDASITSHSQGA